MIINTVNSIVYFTVVVKPHSWFSRSVHIVFFTSNNFNVREPTFSVVKCDEMACLQSGDSDDV